MAKVLYQFVASGQNEVIAAFKGVSAAARESERAQVGASQRSSRMSRKASDEAIAHVTAKEKAGYRSLARSESQIEREARAHDKALKHVSGIRDRHFRDQQRLEDRASRQAENRAAQRVATERRAQEQISAHRTSRVLDVVGSVGTAAVLGGAALVGAAARENIQLRETVNRLAINAQAAGQPNVDRDATRRQFEDIAISTPGIKSQQVGQAALAYQAKTGELLGPQQLDALATASSAAGADIEDMAQAMAAISEKFNVKSLADTQDALAGLISQGAKGAFEIKDAADQFDRLTAAAGSFGIGEGPAAVKTLFGFAQIARTAVGNPRAAVTAIENVFSHLSAKAPALKKDFGIDVYGEGNKPRAIQDILIDTVAKVGGNDAQKKSAGLTQLFGAQGIRALNPLIKTYMDAIRDNKDGLQALKNQLSEATSTTAKWSDVQEMASLAQNDSSARVIAAWEKLVSVVGEEVVPELLPLIDQLPNLVNVMFPIIDIFQDLADTVGSVIDVLSKIPGFEPSTATKKREAERELKRAEKELKSFDIIGPMMPEQEAYKAGLVKKVEAARGKVEGAEGAVNQEKFLEENGVGKSHVTAIGGVMGAVIGGIMGGYPGAALGGAAGAGLGSLAESSGKIQAKERLDNQNQGYLETNSGAVLSTPEFMEIKTAMGGIANAAEKAAKALQQIQPQPTVAPTL